MKLFTKLNLKQIIKFTIAGGFAALANIISRILFSIFFPYKLSILFSFFVGLTTGFILMRRYVFIFKKNILFRQIIRFFFINLLNLIQTFLITLGIKYLLGFILSNIGIIELFAHILGVSFPIMTSYFAHKYFTFQ
tara:strand:- start:206 stop:613 length:408 start_codon:yes stop_codon:yes gene_type:complete